jgi:hypothetical protein
MIMVNKFTQTRNIIKKVHGPAIAKRSTVACFETRKVRNYFCCGSLPWEPPTGYEIAIEVTVTQIGIQETARLTEIYVEDASVS